MDRVERFLKVRIDMNMFRAFEGRIAKVFEASSQDAPIPFSFRKLARRAAREMEQETYVVDGVNTAPALITVLVSPDDDAVLKPFYAQLTKEISDLIEAEAAHKGYVFVGKPLARFMVDSSLRRGRFAVFANNVDALTLQKLREEEEAFLSGFGSFGGAAAPIKPAIVTPIEEPGAPAHIDDIPVVEHAISDDSSAGLTVLPADFVDESLNPEPSSDFGRVSAPDPVASEPRSLADALPEVVAPNTPIVTPMPEVLGASVPVVPEIAAGPAEMVVPGAPVPHVHNIQDSTINAAPVPVMEVEKDPVTCLLIDRQSGRTYIGTEPETIIGRERTQGSIVLHDPNVSRVHAKLSYDGTVWRIHDLGSTNGTLVNDVDVDSCVLRDGDLITLGLLNLEFRES